MDMQHCNPASHFVAVVSDVTGIRGPEAWLTPAAQAVLLWTQMGLFFWYSLSLFWSPATSAAAKAHLRVLMAAKTVSFVFSALQLRNGFPPPASYRRALLPSA